MYVATKYIISVILDYSCNEVILTSAESSEVVSSFWHFICKELSIVHKAELDTVHNTTVEILLCTQPNRQ